MTRSPFDLGRPSGPDFVVPDREMPATTAPPTPPTPQSTVPIRIGEIPRDTAAAPSLRHGADDDRTEPAAAPRRSAGRTSLLVVGCLLAGAVAGGGAGLIAGSVFAPDNPFSSSAVAPGPPGGTDARAAASTLLPSVVQIRAGAARGSGFAIDPAGRVLTNHHVIAGATTVEVQLADGRVVGGRVVGSDPATDIAVVEVTGATVPPADLGESTGLRIGQAVIAVGSPLGLSSTVTAGIVSAVDRPARLSGPGRGEQPMVQTDASINPGNSGGPLADLEGRVVGVNTAIATVGGAESGNIGIGFAVPIDRALRIARTIIANN
ncbi:trypsin-like peptidase domain-containing protein [Gordonia sp. ABSL11-1]|uniref:S1C family serine protease n=1 Tax=Gordonia sp. ABSL11-1 TaxID=3053924 RepID=UPI0025737E18|nr:trypsin-like peptidase domain-containing protein [Gordonia sp. ABSL11-1]MDL9948339.1 trypsin-like peptidase domain-containing protein [Gordonia sp. ABSL11-1]